MSAAGFWVPLPICGHLVRSLNVVPNIVFGQPVQP